MNLIRKTLVAAVAVGTFGAILAAAATEASARGGIGMHFGSPAGITSFSVVKNDSLVRHHRFRWGYTGLATTLAASQYYSTCSLQWQPVFDANGNFVDYRNIRVCP